MTNYTIYDLLSYALRHKPEILGITVDQKGWAFTEDVFNALNQKGFSISKQDFLGLIQTDSRKRYSFNRDMSKLRANFGHTLNVKLELAEMMPPTILYHGTTPANIELIMKSGGISKMQREFVYLSWDEETALRVGQRHGTPQIISIFARAMYDEGCTFYLAPNDVWLTDNIPIQYILY